MDIWILNKNIRVIGWNNITSIPLSNDFCNSESDDSNEENQI